MKRIGNLYYKIYDINNLKAAFNSAKQGKNSYLEVQMIKENPMPYLLQIQKMLKNKTFHTSKYQTFTREEGGKVREISKLPFYPDRIVQWAIIRVIEPYMEKNFINDTYSAIKGKGVHYGKHRVETAIKRDGENCKYCLKLDMYHYYQSIHHELLKQQYRKLFKDKNLLWIIDEIIDSTDGEIGIPIGNYLSQFSGNLYLSSLDHYIKEKLGVKHYFRYMDDIVILSDNKSELRILFNKINNYANNTLQIKIKPNYQIFPTYIRGLDFLGYRRFRKFSLLRKRVKQNAIRKLKKYLKKAIKIDMISLFQCNSICSYKGWMCHCNSHKLINKYIVPLFPYMTALWNKLNGQKRRPKKYRRVSDYEVLWGNLQRRAAS